MVFRMDKYGIILEAFIRTLSIQILFGHHVAPMGQIKGNNSAPILKVCTHMKFAFSSLLKKYTIRNLV